ncbi:Hypothetical predicted protein [Paramuricea clavata]|uniref:Uncharacterized protein n=1 Tax=Paramuricea clavata TaxID=317549 RepID=A0A7D9J1E4_PARCT|nr:Hypothetical predicted protein [Paramuricea clavata]
MAKPSDTIETSSNRKIYNRADENKKTSEVSELKKTIAEQKENITNREKHLLHLEKKVALLEHENSKNKKQILSFREKLKDSSVYDYESAEHSRKIAVSHLQEVERACQESHLEKPDSVLKQTVQNSGITLEKNSEELIAHLNSMKDVVQTLRSEKEALQNDHNNLSSFFAESLKILFKQVRDKGSKLPGNNLHTVPENTPITPGEDVFQKAKEPSTDSEDVNDLDAFKKKLKSNEQCIDELANQIRDLENRKKGLLETRFAMIQEFQAGGEVPKDWKTDMSGNDAEEKVENETVRDRKRSRVTKKIRKLERTLSMDHGVGKLDCIQKLCKKLEDCGQRIHELEATNSELRAGHEDMEEEAKYLKYVLSYRGDILKAQLQNKYETKMAAIKDELAQSKTSRSEVMALTKRNHDLEVEVRRLHEELNTLLQNLPAFQVAQRSSSRSSENAADVTANSLDVSLYLENSKNGEDISRNADGFSDNMNQNTVAGNSEISGEKSQNDNNNSNDGDNSQNLSGEALQSLEEKVFQLTEEKRVLLLGMQTLTSQWTSRENCPESDSSAVTVREANLREVEQENACLFETLQRIRNVLDDEREHENNNGQEDKILKLKDEIQRLDEKVEANRSRSFWRR